jgi:hypothetical protein
LEDIFIEKGKVDEEAEAIGEKKKVEEVAGQQETIDIEASYHLDGQINPC